MLHLLYYTVPIIQNKQNRVSPECSEEGRGARIVKRTSPENLCTIRSRSQSHITTNDCLTNYNEPTYPLDSSYQRTAAATTDPVSRDQSTSASRSSETCAGFYDPPCARL